MAVRNDCGVKTGGDPHGVTYSVPPPSEPLSLARVVPGTIARGPVGAKPVIVVEVSVTRRSPVAKVRTRPSGPEAFPIVVGGSAQAGAPVTRSSAPIHHRMPPR